ncbi:TIGR03084 family metal-binding protein [Pseudonocardia acaciae]|uniref:TIGR03084 family metal-binding protein n=1 Tax=Pseudonocardia acaciae TaxID=551276 RepID=UPI00048C4F93|nr:TIGR03084 family metal-binding protein [Pseudonocardia acaciae]
MPVTMSELTGDLAEETGTLRALLAGLDPAGWELATPAEGWAVRDQVSHLAYFDDAAIRSAVDPDGFTADMQRTLTSGLTPDDIAARYRDLHPDDLLAWFDSSRAGLIKTFAALDPGKRVPWFGPPMSAASSVTARLMETWAHGQDVADALGVVREPTDRLRHVAHIGVRALPFSYALRGLEAPEAPVRVELTAPTGDLWTWGPPDAADVVRAPALDFCLLVTQRRHRDDLTLEVTGKVATEWTTIAQAFAGAPGPGRAPLPRESGFLSG